VKRSTLGEVGLLHVYTLPLVTSRTCPVPFHDTRLAAPFNQPKVTQALHRTVHTTLYSEPTNIMLQAAITPPPAQTFRLLELPAELRCLIYAFAFEYIICEASATPSGLYPLFFRGWDDR